MSASRYEEVLAVLAGRIDSGYYFRNDPDGRMETMAQMRAEFGVGNTTLRTALAILKDRGVVRSEQGKRWFVIRATARRDSSGVSADEGPSNGLDRT